MPATHAAPPRPQHVRPRSVAAHRQQPRSLTHSPPGYNPAACATSSARPCGPAVLRGGGALNVSLAHVLVVLRLERPLRLRLRCKLHIRLAARPPCASAPRLARRPHGGPAARARRRAGAAGRAPLRLQMCVDTTSKSSKKAIRSSSVAEYGRGAAALSRTAPAAGWPPPPRCGCVPLQSGARAPSPAPGGSLKSAPPLPVLATSCAEGGKPYMSTCQGFLGHGLWGPQDALVALGAFLFPFVEEEDAFCAFVVVHILTCQQSACT